MLTEFRLLRRRGCLILPPPRPGAESFTPSKTYAGLGGHGMFGFEKAGKGFALIAITVLAGCQSPSPDAVETRVSALTSGDILGFEAVTGWSVTQGPVQSITLTTTRTKGASALALTKPSGNVRID